MPTLIPNEGSSVLSAVFLFSSALTASFFSGTASALPASLFSASEAFGSASAAGVSSSSSIPNSAACFLLFFSSILASSSADKVLYLCFPSSDLFAVAAVFPDSCIVSCSFLAFAAFAAFSFSTCALTAAINASL